MHHLEQERTQLVMEPTKPPTWLTLEQLAEMYNIPVGTVRRWIRIKLLDARNGAHKFGGQWRVKLSEFETKFIDKK